MRLIKEFHFYDELLSLQEAFTSRKAKDWREKLKQLCDEEGGDYEAACRALNVPMGGPEDLSEDIQEYLNDSCYGGQSSDWYYENGVINTKGSFRLNGNLITEDGVLRPEITFGTCKGNFDASSRNLTSLERFPREIEGSFEVSYNKNLTSLEGCPESVRNFRAHACGLTSLIGCPSYVNGYFDVSNNHNLVSLEGTQNCDVQGEINVSYCGLETLRGGFSNYNPPASMEFNCKGNNLKTLIGAPKSTQGYSVDCSMNPNLFSIEGIPLKRGKNLIAKGCLLPQKSLIELFLNAIKFESWIAAYFYLIATPQFQRMSRAQRTPIRERISAKEMKSKSFALSPIWRDPIMKDRAVQRLLKTYQLSDKEKEGIDSLSDLADMGIF